MTDAADNPELLSLRYVDIDTLSAWDRNAKKHDVGALVESIVRHGFRDPPAYDSALNAGAGGVAEGNGRADALRMMRAQQMQPPRGILLQDGRWFAPVLFGVDSASQAAAEAYAVAHNNLTMAGGDFTDLDMSKMWDSVGYADLLADLARQGESPVTIDETALDALLAALNPDIVVPDPAPQQEPASKSECFIEIYCTAATLQQIRSTLDSWVKVHHATVNIS